ncbi:MAG: PKD domain-containing protein [Nitrospiraceae bacterium]|nr:PKD domain-containing protein [Nitrospiraceae bacterium]
MKLFNAKTTRAFAALLSLLVLVPLMTGCPGTSTPSTSDTTPAPNTPDTALTVALSSTAADPTEVSPIPVSVRFSAAVAVFSASDIVTENATVANLTGSGADYQFDLIPQSEGLVSASISASLVSAPHKSAPNFSRYYRANGPAVTMTTDLPATTAAFPIPVNVEFTKAVTGFGADDLAVTNATVGTFTGSEARYTFELVPNEDGAITVDIPADAAFDAASAGNEAAEQFAITFATAPAPTAVIDIYQADWLDGAAVSATQSYAPMAVFFEGWQSTPRDDIATYEWNFGDGAETFKGFNAAHVYQTPGTYTASLTVTNQYGWSDVATVVIDVLAADGTTYYVDAEYGDDANPGTSLEQPWRTAAHAFNGTYQAGDQILFQRGQTFLLEGGAVSSSAWRDTHGYKFGAYGDGPKPLIQLAGTGSGILLPNPRYFAYVTFENLHFNMTSAEGATNTLVQMTQQIQNVLFLGCDIENCESAFLMQNDVTGAFLVDCTVFNSASMQIYTTCARVAMIDSVFDLSENHIAYLEVINKGVITGSTFSRSAFGRHALRLSGRTEPTTNNVVITKNDFRGWVEPGETRYNWMLVHLAPNVPELQFMSDVLFEDNILEDAETLLNIGNFENIIVRRNEFRTADTYTGGRRVIIGSKHGFDTMPVRNCRITENTFLMQAAVPGATSIFSILDYDAEAYEGRTRHENIRIDKNEIVMVGGTSRVLWFESADAAQRAEVSTSENVIYNAAQNDGLYQVGGGFYSGNVYTLAQWQADTGDAANTQIAATNAPLPGWATI